jgi:hypothetical protein
LALKLFHPINSTVDKAKAALDNASDSPPLEKNPELIHERTECSHDQLQTSRRTYPRNRVFTFHVPDRVQQASAAVGTACATAGPVCNRRHTSAVVTGDSGCAGVGARAAPDSGSTTPAADYSRGDLTFYADFECHRFENQLVRRSF